MLIMSLKNVSALGASSALALKSLPLNSGNKGGETITVTMRGQTPAAHAEAILAHYKFTRADETRFKELFGYDLRQHLTDSYAKNDDRQAHTALGRGLYRVVVPVDKQLLEQIREVKNAGGQQVKSQSIKQAQAEKIGVDRASLLRAETEKKLSPDTNRKATAGDAASTKITDNVQLSPHFQLDENGVVGIDKVELPTTTENAGKLSVTIETFIPFDRVTAMNNPYDAPFESAFGRYEGDNRDVGQQKVLKDGKIEDATYRTVQRMDVDLNMPEGVDIPCTVEASQCIQDKNAGMSRDYSIRDDNLKLREDRATGKTMKATARREGDTITITAGGNEGNPLITGAPGITYNLKITIKKDGESGKATITVEGAHDHFPAYEVFVSRTKDDEKKLIYGFDPRTKGYTPLSLMDDTTFTQDEAVKTMRPTSPLGFPPRMTQGQKLVKTQTTIVPVTNGERRVQ